MYRIFKENPTKKVIRPTSLLFGEKSIIEIAFIKNPDVNNSPTSMTIDFKDILEAEIKRVGPHKPY